MSSSKQKAPRVSSVRVRLPVPDEENRSVTACSTPFYRSLGLIRYAVQPPHQVPQFQVGAG